MNYITISDFYKRNSGYFDVSIPQLYFNSGKVYGIFGPNGSGKTTLLKAIAKLNTSYSGNISVQGSISFLPDNLDFMSWMNVSDMIKFYKDFYKDFNQERFDFMFEEFNAERSTLLSSLSNGQLELVFLSLTFAREVQIYILDEPFHGLNIEKQESSIRKILTLIDENTTLIMTTHYPYDIENIFDEALFMQYGRIVGVLDVHQNNSIVATYKEVFGNV